MARRADVHTRLSYAAAWVRGRSDLRPAVGVVLGSGLSPIGDGLADAASIPYAEIPEFPEATVEGHAGRLVLGGLGGVVVGAMQGRVHAYEGHSADDVAFGVRLLARLGVRALVLTNAAGGLNPAFAPGDLVRIRDHLNLTGASPLTGPNDDRVGPRFPDMSEAYDARLGALLDACAGRLGIPLASGVYAGVPGPSYETPAEVAMLRTLGADLVGMSTVLEVLAARHMGVPVVAISVVTNAAAGASGPRLAHADVLAAAAGARERVATLLRALLPEVARATEGAR
jgi:purine-nucleoside phosphorylase